MNDLASPVLSDLLPRTEDMAKLDTLVNGDGDEVDFMTLLVIACLGRGPHVDHLVMRAAPDRPVYALVQIAVHLRTSVKLGRGPRHNARVIGE